MAITRSGSKAVAVFVKDIRSELKTRYAVSAIVMFGVVTVVAIGFASAGIAPEYNLQAILLWLVIYFASIAGLSQCFVKEEENRTADALRIYAPATAVYGGKLLFNLVLLICLELVIVPLFALMIGLEIKCYSLFYAILILGTFGLAFSTTLVGAIISKTSMKGVLFAVLAFPLLLPLLIMAISGTIKSLTAGMVFSDGLPELKVLLSYAVVMFAAGFLLFDYVWND
jgi:heme exporter protein B